MRGGGSVKEKERAWGEGGRTTVVNGRVPKKTKKRRSMRHSSRRRQAEAEATRCPGSPAPESEEKQHGSDGAADPCRSLCFTTTIRRYGRL